MGHAVWTDGNGNEPYDPDMTVQEAIALGLVEVVDYPVVQPGTAACGYEYVRKDEQSYICLRRKDHNGPHARMLRWRESWRDIEKREKEQAELDRAYEERRRLKKVEEAEANKARMDALRIAAKALPMQDIGQEMKKIGDAMSKALEKKEQREWSAVPRNFRDQSAGKIRGPKR